ncbi:MAG: hypothetical protein ACQXXG_08820 [Candidatus Bathyarchaeia archaeon]|jgi:hypothetical protein|nr:hypothetical protein [Candidatus Bathyarchaeota archaeon A05DMB-3]
MSQPELRIPKIPYEEARANVVLWKKGRKRKPIDFFYSAWNLVQYYGGSSEKVAEEVKDITAWMITKAAFAAEVIASSKVAKRLYEEGKLSFDVIAESKGIKDPELRDRVLETVSDMKLALDQRQVVRYVKQHPNASFEQFKERVLASKDVTERVYLAILPLVEEEYKQLKEESKKLKMSWDGLCMKIIKDWLNARRHE